MPVSHHCAFIIGHNRDILHYIAEGPVIDIKFINIKLIDIKFIIKLGKLVFTGRLENISIGYGKERWLL